MHGCRCHIGGKEGDKERKDEGQKTNPMEIKGDNEEKRQKAQTFLTSLTR